MKRFSLLALLSVFLRGVILNINPVQAQQAECHPLAPIRNQNVVLITSRSFCLQNDIQIDDGSPFVAHGRDRPGYAIDIVGSDLTLDLQGHVIRVGDITSGIVMRSRNSPLPARVSIRNGEIHAGIGSGFYNAIIPSDIGNPLANVSKYGMSQTEIQKMAERFSRRQQSTLDQQNQLRPATPSAYQKRDIHLENLHIYALGHFEGNNAGGAINIQGGGTVIRNCVIETDDGNAIWIFGPNAVIENNTIIVHGKNRLREADAAIRLIQADGAVIRNNKIVIKDDANRRGISVFDTGPITVENNTFYGMTEKDEVAKAFIGSLQMKGSGNQFESGWKAMFGIRQ